MAPDKPSTLRQQLWLLERGLYVIGLAALGWYAGIHVVATLDQMSQNRTLERLRSERAVTAPRTPADVPLAPAPRPKPEPAALIGRVEIPRLGVSAIVREGVDDATLRRAVGHIPETALPGERGNAALAAHRDTFFRPLKQVRKGDRIQVTTPDGTHEYAVSETRVVDPEDVWVLDPTPQPTLTLVTCYPFNYVGSAPRRFIVRATGVETPPVAATGPPPAPVPVLLAGVAPAMPFATGERTAGTAPAKRGTGTSSRHRVSASKVSKAKASKTSKPGAKRAKQKEKRGWRTLFGLLRPSRG